jgi:hypothetical protein
MPLFGEGDVDVKDPGAGKGEKSTKPNRTTTKAEADAEKKEAKINYGSTAANSGTTEEEKMEEGTEVLMDRAEAKYAKTKLVDPETLKPHKPGQNACLWLFHLLEGVTTVVCICLMATQLFPFFMMKLKDIGVLNMFLKAYISLFCLLFILTETNAPVPQVRRSALLQPYATRGFLYSFLGLICVEEAYSERVKDIVSFGSNEFHISWAAIFMEITSWLMLSCGVLYGLLGICCMKRLHDHMKQNEIDAWKRYHEELKRWKERFG